MKIPFYHQNTENFLGYLGVPRFNFVSAGRAFRGSAIAPLLRNSFAAPTIPHASKLAGKEGFFSRLKKIPVSSTRMTIIQHTVKKSFRHCERSAAVHFLDCHVALLLAMTKQEELVAFFTDIPNLLHSIPHAT